MLFAFIKKEKKTTTKNPTVITAFLFSLVANDSDLLMEEGMAFTIG